MIIRTIFVCLLLVAVSSANNTEHELQKRMDLLEQRYASDIMRLEAANQQLAKENDKIKARLDSLTTQVEQCTRQLETSGIKEKTPHALGTIDNTGRLRSSKRKRTVARQQSDHVIDKTMQHVNDHKRALTEGTNIAFTAYLDHDLVNQGPSEVLIFNKVLINHGNAYNNFSGMFTAPMAGVYSFTFFIGERDANQYWVRLFVNNQHKAGFQEIKSVLIICP